jgi:hypothetical protein
MGTSLLCDQELWWKYQQVAMHFNQLIIQFRVQALGGLVAASTAAGVFLGSKGLKLHDRNRVLRHAFTLLLFVWVAIAVLDLFYYQLLLKGAVKALVDYEKDCPFQLSTYIERAAGPGHRWWESRSTWYYSLSGLPILLYVGLKWTERGRELWDQRVRGQRHPTSDARSASELVSGHNGTEGVAETSPRDETME